MRLQSDERVLFRGHPCWQSMLGFHVRALALAILAGALAGVASSASAGHVQAGWVVLGVLAAFAVSALLGLLRRAATTYTVTDRRLVIERGLLGRDVQEARLDRVQNVVARQSVRQRMLGVGTVHFDTAGGLDFDFCFRGVAWPREIVAMVNDALREHEEMGAFW